MMKVLLPIDGSDSSQVMLEWAATHLDKTNNQFLLLTVIADPMIAEYEIEDGIKMLNEARQYLESHHCRVLKSEYIKGDPVDSICRYAIDEKVDQVLMGSHGRSGLAKVLLGSVSEGVLERCKVPVFIYRTLQRQEAASRS